MLFADYTSFYTSFLDNPTPRPATTYQGLSIGTGLAFETFFPQNLYDPERTIPTPHHPLTAYKGIFINVTTLMRNVLSSYPLEEHTHLLDIIRGEMAILIHLLPLRPIFYRTNYDSFLKQLPLTRARLPTTPKQKAEARQVQQTLHQLDNYQPPPVIFTQALPKGLPYPSLVFTHQVADLLLGPGQNPLTLLESNTGKTKIVTEFATKFYKVPTEATPYVPFNRLVFSFLGDKSLLHPGPAKLRQQFFEIAQQKKWHTMTSVKSLLQDLNTGSTANLKLFLQLLPQKVKHDNASPH